MKAKDLSGYRFGMWVVISRRPKSKWLCQCDCGTVKEVHGCNLTSGKSTCCGCNAIDVAKRNFTKHGHSNSDLYRTWATIKARCYRTTHIEYHRYGARGITMYPDWVEDYAAFEDYVVSNIGYKPAKEYSIDRVDNAIGYFPGNLRWATMKEQSNNRRSNRTITYKGITKTLQQWADILGIAHSTLRERLEKYSIEEALEDVVDDGDW